MYNSHLHITYSVSIDSIQNELPVWERHNIKQGIGVLT